MLPMNHGLVSAAETERRWREFLGDLEDGEETSFMVEFEKPSEVYELRVIDAERLNDESH